MGDLFKVRDSGRLLHLQRAGVEGKTLCGANPIDHWPIRPDKLWTKYPELRCRSCKRLDGSAREKMIAGVEELRVMLAAPG